MLDTTSDQYAAQKISSIIQTEIGELPITPLYGLDPAEFDQFDVASLTYGVARSFPEIQLQTITEDIKGDGTVNIKVEFKQNSLI